LIQASFIFIGYGIYGLDSDPAFSLTEYREGSMNDVNKTRKVIDLKRCSPPSGRQSAEIENDETEINEAIKG
jgi:hypothetical protein